MAGFLGMLLLALCPSAPAAQNLIMSWNANPDPAVAGYNIYYGAASGNYTNIISVGNVTNASISGPVGGVTYYFAVTAFDASGVESVFSTEVSYTVPVAVAAKLQASAMALGILHLAGVGQAGHTYEIQASTDLIVWTVIGTQTVDSNSSFQFADPNAKNFPARYYRIRDTQL